MRIRLVLLCSLLFVFSTCTKDHLSLEENNSSNFHYNPDEFTQSELASYANAQGISLQEENITKINRYGTPEFISSEKLSGQKSGNRKKIKLYYKDDNGKVKHKTLTLLTVDESIKNGEVEVTKNFYFEDNPKDSSKSCNEPILEFAGKPDTRSSEKGREGCGTTWLGDLLRNIVGAIGSAFEEIVDFFQNGGGGDGNSNGTPIIIVSGSSAGQTWNGYSPPGTTGPGLSYNGGGYSAGSSRLGDYDGTPVYNFSLESALELSPYTDSPEEIECLYEMDIALDLDLFLMANNHSRIAVQATTGFIDYVCSYQEIPFDVLEYVDQPVIVKNAITILEEVKQNPAFLLEIDCDQLPYWQSLAQHQAPSYVKNKIINLNNSYNDIFDDWAIQTLTGAKGVDVNMDYFSTKVYELPHNPVNGRRFTPEDFLDHYRRDINSFSDTWSLGSRFEPYCQVSSTICQNETSLWESNNPLGALIYIDIGGPDDGSVVCTDYEPNYWRFTTIRAPGSGTHPVSGHREFGFESNNDGTFNFYTRGVDRFKSSFIEKLISVGGITNQFTGADQLWNQVQVNLAKYINDNGGTAIVNAPILDRPDWSKVVEVLEGRRPISDLGCK